MADLKCALGIRRLQHEGAATLHERTAQEATAVSGYPHETSKSFHPCHAAATHFYTADVDNSYFRCKTCGSSCFGGPMSKRRVAAPVLVVAIATGWPTELCAQDVSTQPAAGAEAVALPEVVVEAPAKRNVKKAQLRKSAPKPSLPQSSPNASAPADAGLPQQVVEGEKVVRTLRDTTTSVGVVTGQDIAERQIRDLDSAIEQTANVITSEDPNSGFVIRGLNSEGQTGLQHISGVPLAGVVIDGATQNPDAVRRGARALWDVEQVEVLRGPQSTLQGRNALGGSIFVKTNDPTYKLGAVVEGTIGTNDLYGAGFVLNSPIVAGQSAFRISGYTTERERDISYAAPANEEMGLDAYDSLRGKLLIEPDSLPGFSALFTVSRTHDEPGSAIVSGPNFLARELNYTPDFTDFRKGKADNYISDLSYEFRPGMTLRSVTAYAKTETEIKTAAGAAFSRYGDHTNGSDFTQDLRLEIANSGNGFSGVLGLFYGRFERDAFGSSTVVLDHFFPGNGLPDFPIFYYEGTVGAATDSVAAYADLRYRLNRWSFIAGGRLLRDTVETDEDGIQFNTTSGGLDVLEGTTKASFEEFLPKLGVTYDLTQNQTVGVTYNKGYRTGFQQIIRTPVVNFSSTVDPEYVDTYELSYRSNWFSRTFEFNANAFYNDYTDQQVVLLNDTYAVSEIFNAGASHSYGAEFEARWRPIPPLQVFAALGLLQTEYDEIEVRDVDYSGNEYPEAPAYTLSAGALYRSPTGWFVGANVRHIDGYYSYGDIPNLSSRFVDGYTVVDARIGWKWEEYTLTLFAKNLLDEKYLTSVDRVDGGPLAPPYGFIGDERQVGLTVTGRF